MIFASFFSGENEFSHRKREKRTSDEVCGHRKKIAAQVNCRNRFAHAATFTLVAIFSRRATNFTSVQFSLFAPSYENVYFSVVWGENIKTKCVTLNCVLWLTQR